MSAFEITVDDVQTVLERSLVDVDDKSAKAIFDTLTTEDFDRIEKSALRNGIDMDDQLDGALSELEDILGEANWID
jgi:hypothetical protein